MSDKITSPYFTTYIDVELACLICTYVLSHTSTLILESYFKSLRSNFGRLSHDEHSRFALFNPNDQQSSAENSVSTLTTC